MDTNILNITCLNVIMVLCITQYLFNIWSSIPEKVKEQHCTYEKRYFFLFKYGIRNKVKLVWTRGATKLGCWWNTKCSLINSPSFPDLNGIKWNNPAHPDFWSISHRYFTKFEIVLYKHFTSYLQTSNFKLKEK